MLSENARRFIGGIAGVFLFMTVLALVASGIFIYINYDRLTSQDVMEGEVSVMTEPSEEEASLADRLATTQLWNVDREVRIPHGVFILHVWELGGQSDSLAFTFTDTTLGSVELEFVWVRKNGKGSDPDTVTVTAR